MDIMFERYHLAKEEHDLHEEEGRKDCIKTTSTSTSTSASFLSITVKWSIISYLFLGGQVSLFDNDVISLPRKSKLSECPIHCTVK